MFYLFYAYKKVTAIALFAVANWAITASFNAN